MLPPSPTTEFITGLVTLCHRLFRKQRCCNRLLYNRRLCLLLLITLPGSVFPDTTAYRSLAAYKAEARHSAQPDVPYVSEGQPSKLAAAINAQQACRQNTGASLGKGHCELVRTGDQEITTAADMLSRVPSGKKPLFLWHYQTPVASVYLAGSVHILKPGLYPLPEQFQHAFEQSGTLVVEVDLNALSPQQIQEKTMQYGMLKPGQTLQSVLPGATYNRLNNITAEYGLPLSQLDNLKPALVSQQLAVSALVSVGYDPSLGVERHFVLQAEDKKIEQLETIDLQLDLLLNQPLETQRQLVEDSLQQMENFETMTAALIVAWLSGDDTTFARLFAAQAGTSDASLAFMRQLIDGRNIGMADKIVAMLQGGGTYFVLIGAGHYVGANNLIELLEKRGYQGRRVYSTQDIRKP